MFAWAEALRQNPHEPEDHAELAQALADVLRSEPDRAALIDILIAAAQHESLPDRDRALSMIASHQAAAGDVVRMLFNLYALLLDTTPPTTGDQTP